MTEENGHPVSRSTVARVEDKVDKLDSDLRSLSEALMGKEGLTDGAIPELRKQYKSLGEKLIAFQDHLPEAINAAVTAADNRRARLIVTGVRNWWVAIAASVISTLIVVGLAYVLHLGVPVAK